MGRLLTPAVSLLNRIKYNHKFSIIGILILLPVGLMMAVIISQAEQKVASLELELATHEYAQRLHSVRLDLHRFHMLEDRFNDDLASLHFTGSEIAEQIAIHVELLNSLHSRYGDALPGSDQWPFIREQLNEVFYGQHEQSTEKIAAAMESFYENVSIERIGNLTDRLERSKLERNRLIVILAVLFAWMAYLWSSLHASVVKPIAVLNQTAKSAIRGKHRFDVQLHLNDDLYPVATALQKFANYNNEMSDRNKSYEQRLQYFANHDPLTELPNRYVFNQRLLETLEKASRIETKIAVLFLDLDRFKTVNDTLGHDAGDYVLKTIADRISSCLGHNDTVSRMGGDEFLILIPNIADIGKAKNMAQHILSILTEPIRMRGRELVMTASIGISVYPDDGQDINTLIKHANTALNAAKDQGRNTYVDFRHIVQSGSDERLNIEMHLRNALDQNELEVYYQPRVNSSTDVVTGMEALLRWNNPELGWISPAHFIPIAEETGAIIPIGEWVLRTACEQCKKWHDAGFPLQLSVNISALQFQRLDFVEVLQEALNDAELDPKYLEIELTESMVMKDVDQTIATLEEVKKIGVGISIDDFGTGFSSLNYLKLLPIDTLKIDQSFIQNTPDDSKDSAITKTIIALARRLELKTVAEGVETLQQMNFLKSRKCNELQGFLISKPLPSERIISFMEKAEAQP